MFLTGNLLELLLAFCLLWQVFSGFVRAEESERTIKEKILKGYDKSISPILYTKENHHSYAHLGVMRIRKLDDVKGEFVIEGVIFLGWTDERLSWESDNITFFRISPDDIWVPQVTILNRVEPNKITVSPISAISSSLAFWLARCVVKTACIPNLKYFPFDKHTCEIILDSISAEGDLLQTNFSAPEFKRNSYVSTDYIIENNSWKLLSSSTARRTMEVEIGLMTDVGVFIFEIERSMPLIALAILTPSVSSIVLLLTTFWMKVGTATRTGINATSILVSAGNLFTISRILPVSGADTPIIVEYVMCALILSLLSAIQTVVMSVMSRYQKQPPISYITIVEKIPKWMLMMLAMTPDVTAEGIVDETFLFSELSETDNRNLPEDENNVLEKSTSTIRLKYPWEKHMMLFDRFVFYLYVIVLLLLIVSILFTE